MSIFFLFSFSFSIMGHTLELHYCQGEFTSISLIGHAECICENAKTNVELIEKESSCQKHCSSKSCHTETNKSELEVKEESCCKTEKLTFLSPAVKALSSTEIPVWTVIVTVLNPTFYIDLIDVKCITPKLYIPPTLDRDVIILQRTLLI